MWQGDFSVKPEAAVREKLLAQRAELVAKIKAIKAAPSPKHGDKEQLARFKMKDLTELAAKVVAIDKKLGRSEGVKMLRV